MGSTASSDVQEGVLLIYAFKGVFSHYARMIMSEFLFYTSSFSFFFSRFLFNFLQYIDDEWVAAKTTYISPRYAIFPPFFLLED